MKDLSQSVQKRNQEETPKEKGIPIPKHTIKDSVFTSLFQEKKYLLELYKTLHPEDKKTTEDSLRNITMKNVLTDGIYNDLGFLAGDRLLILVEAQTTWTVNIILRALLYLAQTYQDYFNREKADLYRSKKVKVPKPELYGEKRKPAGEDFAHGRIFPGRGMCPGSNDQSSLRRPGVGRYNYER